MARDLFDLKFEGHLGKTPVLRHTTTNKTPVCDLSVAVDRSYKDKDGTLVEQTAWLKVVAWGRQAETCAKYLAVGRRVRVTVGRCGSEAWLKEDPDTGVTTISHRPVFHARLIDFLPGGTRSEIVTEDDFMDADFGYEAEVVPMVAVFNPMPDPAPTETTAPAKRPARRKRTTAPLDVPVHADFADLDIGF